MAKNRLVAIGCMGGRRAYLNVPEEEAIRRWFAANPDAEHPASVYVYEFDEEFDVYDVWTDADVVAWYEALPPRQNNC